MPAKRTPAAPSAGRRNRAADTAGIDAEKPEYRVEALAKGLRILSLFDEQRPTWRVTDLASTSGLPMPTVYRVVMTLTSEGYLDHLPNGDYRPGVRTLTLGTAALRSLDLVGIASPKLQQLGERTGETVNLAVLTGDRVLYLVRLRNSDLVTANIQVGSTLPAVTTSIGKLLLAYLPDPDLRGRITAASFDAQHGPNAKETLSELLVELKQIRAQGWAKQDEELAYGLRSVAGPIQGPDGRVVAGVNLAVQARDWSTERIVDELKPVLLDTCAEISALLSDRALDGPPGMTGAGARLAKLAPDSLDADQRAVYRAITGGPRATGPKLFDLVDEDGRLEGPFNAFLLQPRLGGPLQELGAAVRYSTSLSDRAREIAILVVSEHWDSAFERYAHEAVARHVGLSDAELAELRAGQYDRLAADEALVAGTTRLLVSAGDLDDRAYAEAIAGLGEAGLFELLTLVGYYSTLALQLRVFRVPAPTPPP